MLPKKLDEKVAALHLAKLGVELTKLTAGAGRVPRRPGRRPVQARSLPVLVGARELADMIITDLVAWDR